MLEITPVLSKPIVYLEFINIKMTSSLLSHSSHCQLAFTGSCRRHDLKRAPIRHVVRASAHDQQEAMGLDWKKIGTVTALSASLCLTGPAW